MYPENGYAEFTTFFRVKFTEDMPCVVKSFESMHEDIVGTFGDVIIRALETRMDSCVSMLMRNNDKITFANAEIIQFKKNNAQVHTFNHQSFEIMQDAIERLRSGEIYDILHFPEQCRQIAKALYWVPEEDKKERNGIGFGRLISTILEHC